MVLSKLCKELNVPFEGVTIETTHIPVDQVKPSYALVAHILDR